MLIHDGLFKLRKQVNAARKVRPDLTRKLNNFVVTAKFDLQRIQDTSEPRRHVTRDEIALQQETSLVSLQAFLTEHGVYN